jgi:hypothetical protein
MNKIEKLIDAVIDAAKNAQEEGHGPDRDYRIAAEKELEKAKAELLRYIKEK